MRIRRRKLPDPSVIGNAGSFFKNPEVSSEIAKALLSEHPGMKAHPGRAGLRKLSAGWMLESCGWKGHREGDAGFSDQHALVLVNHGSASGGELVRLAEKAAHSVHDSFGIALEPEPRIIGRPWQGPA